MQTTDIKACVNCKAKRARWDSIYCSDNCKSQFLASLQKEGDEAPYSDGGTMVCQGCGGECMEHRWSTARQIFLGECCTEQDDEDPPCECYYIAADVADASLCRVHGGAR